MRYALLICTDESAQAAASPEEIAQVMKAYDAFGAEMGARGVIRGAERLRPTTDATTVRVSGGDCGLYSQIGLTSTVPCWAAGTFDAISMASSRSLQSTR